ncbi:nuclear transport factor 2 family protein [candidate division KSB1 bacterium]|nr:nuclear transport factor 2 family protein [candidate division KSB1 bacterium]
MKTLILLLSVLLLVTSCEMAQNTLTQEEVEQAILAKERMALDRWSAGDPAGFASVFADDVTYFDDIGASARLEGLEEVQAYLASLEGQIPVHDYEIVDHMVQVYDDIAISTMQYHGSVDGQAGPPWKATDVYRLINGEWKMVHGHWSLVKIQ